jgi:hypothetical protein
MMATYRRVANVLISVRQALATASCACTYISTVGTYIFTAQLLLHTCRVVTYE